MAETDHPEYVYGLILRPVKLAKDWLNLLAALELFAKGDR
jgi:hypothetical protein